MYREVVAVSSRRVPKWMAALMVLFGLGAAATAAGAQETGDGQPDLSTGWVLRSSEVSGETISFGALAGTSDIGFVVIDERGGIHSRDGVDWTPFMLEDPVRTGAHVFDVAAGPRGFVAIGTLGFGNPTIWHSRDGLSWTHIDPAGLPEPATPTITEGGIHKVFAGPNGFVVTGTHQCEQFAWFSSDGRNWSAASLPEKCGDVLIEPLDGGWIAWAWLDGEPALLESGDGRTWAETSAVDVPAGIFSPGGFAVKGETLVIAGAAPNPDGAGVLPAVWVSTDEGETWTETAFEESTTDPRTDAFAVFSMTTTDLGFVGSYFFEASDGLKPGSLVFSSDGVSWQQYLAPEVFFEMVASQDSVVATGIDGVFTWTPPGSELAATGGPPVATLVVLGGFLVIVGAAVLASGKRTPAPGS